MCKVKEKYDSFKANEVETWKNRFTWGGLNGKNPKYTTTIFKFINECKPFDVEDKPMNTKSLFEFISKMGDKYVEWVISKTNYSKAEKEDMRDFFVGAIGEFFFVELLNEIGGIMIPTPSSNNFERFDFHYVSPSLKEDRDFGVDLTGIANDIPCVFQVKFWNPFGRKPVSIDLFQKADSVGSRNGFIKQEDDNNIFLCWLGSEEKADMIVKSNKDFKNKVVILGSRSLEASINDRNKIFWENFYKKLYDMATMA